MISTGKLAAFAIGAIVVGVSAWGWRQAFHYRGLFLNLEPNYRACMFMPIAAETEATCTQALASTELDAQTRANVLVRRGIFYNTAARYREAAGDFSAALGLLNDAGGPDALAALSDRSYSEAMLGNNAKAWADADRIVALAPDDGAGYDARAFLHGHARQFALAARDYDALIRRNPDSAYGYNNRCWYRAIANELPGATADCDKALDIDPNYSAAIDSRAFVYFRMGEYAKARDEYDAAVLAGSYEAATFYMRGVTKLRLGGTSGGVADIAQAKSLDPKIADRFAEYGVRP